MIDRRSREKIGCNSWLNVLSFIYGAFVYFDFCAIKLNKVKGFRQLLISNMVFWDNIDKKAMMASFHHLSLLFVIATTIAYCGGESPKNKEPKPVNKDYSEFTYELPSADYPLGVRIQPNKLKMEKSAVYGAEEDLPFGLYVDAKSGIIAGIPRAAAANKKYSIFATDSDGGHWQAFVEITVIIKEGPAKILGYSQEWASYVVGQEIEPNYPAIEGSDPLVFSVFPALPAGLTSLCVNDG